MQFKSNLSCRHPLGYYRWLQSSAIEQWIIAALKRPRLHLCAQKSLINFNVTQTVLDERTQLTKMQSTSRYLARTLHAQHPPGHPRTHQHVATLNSARSYSYAEFIAKIDEPLSISYTIAILIGFCSTESQVNLGEQMIEFFDHKWSNLQKCIVPQQKQFLNQLC